MRKLKLQLGFSGISSFSDWLCVCWILSALIYYFLQNCIYIYMNLYQFLKTRTSDTTFIGHDSELKWLTFTLYPLSFLLYRPFNYMVSGRNVYILLKNRSYVNSDVETAGCPMKYNGWWIVLNAFFSVLY